MRKLERKTVEWLVKKKVEWSNYASRMLTADDDQLSELYMKKTNDIEREINELIERDFSQPSDKICGNLFLAKKIVDAVYSYGVDKAVKCLEICGVEVV